MTDPPRPAGAYPAAAHLPFLNSHEKQTFFSLAFAVPVVCGSIVGATAADYFISAESVVNAINAQCSTQYEKLDYLRIGQTAMLRMCETRQKRIDIH